MVWASSLKQMSVVLLHSLFFTSNWVMLKTLGIGWIMAILKVFYFLTSIFSTITSMFQDQIILWKALFSMK